MKALQTSLSSIPASVFLSSDRKTILLLKHGDKNFIDFQQGQDMAAWTKDALCIGDKSYKYNTWTIVEDNPELKDYFREVLRDSLEHI